MDDQEIATTDAVMSNSDAAATIASPIVTEKELEIRVHDKHVDEQRFATLWNIAMATMDGDVSQSRTLSGRLLGFLCNKKCGFVVATPNDAKYLDDWFERDNSILYDWTGKTEKVEVLAQHMQLPVDVLPSFLEQQKFDATRNYSPRRATRVEWFNNNWNVG